MPDLLSRQSAGEKFFANAGEDSILRELDSDVLAEMTENEMVRYGEHFVNRDSSRFLSALAQQLGIDWIESNLGTRNERLCVDQKGNLKRIDVWGTQITTLPKLPARLEYLSCYINPLVALPELPAGLKELQCQSTPLVVFPELPDSLTQFNCSSTKIATLPELPAGLTVLYCSFTEITTIPKLPAGLKELYCVKTPLANDPVKRANLETECKARGIKLTI